MTKKAVDGYADERGMSLTTAVVDLLARGLEAAENEASIHKIEVEIARLRAERKTSDARVREAETHAREAMKREATLTSAYRGLAERIKQDIGKCPACQVGVTGEDLLVSTACRNGHSLVSMFGKPNPEYMFLVGALGVLVGIALSGSGGS